MPPVGLFINAGAEPEWLRAVLSESGQDLAGDKPALDHRIEELRREESGLTRLGAKLEDDDDALESILTELREVRARRRVKEDTRSGCTPNWRTRRCGSVG